MHGSGKNTSAIMCCCSCRSSEHAGTWGLGTMVAECPNHGFPRFSQHHLLKFGGAARLRISNQKPKTNRNSLLSGELMVLALQPKYAGSNSKVADGASASIITTCLILYSRTVQAAYSSSGKISSEHSVCGSVFALDLCARACGRAAISFGRGVQRWQL